MSLKELKVEAKDDGVPDDIIKRAKGKEELQVLSWGGRLSSHQDEEVLMHQSHQHGLELLPTRVTERSHTATSSASAIPEEKAVYNP